MNFVNTLAQMISFKTLSTLFTMLEKKVASFDTDILQVVLNVAAYSFAPLTSLCCPNRPFACSQ